jgi:hypothetical protein
MSSATRERALLVAFFATFFAAFLATVFAALLATAETAVLLAAFFAAVLGAAFFAADLFATFATAFFAVGAPVAAAVAGSFTGGATFFTAFFIGICLVHLGTRAATAGIIEPAVFRDGADFGDSNPPIDMHERSFNQLLEIVL